MDTSTQGYTWRRLYPIILLPLKALFAVLSPPGRKGRYHTHSRGSAIDRSRRRGRFLEKAAPPDAPSAPLNASASRVLSKIGHSYTSTMSPRWDLTSSSVASSSRTSSSFLFLPITPHGRETFSESFHNFLLEEANYQLRFPCISKSSFSFPKILRQYMSSRQTPSRSLSGWARNSRSLAGFQLLFCVIP
jgi:hypothetical protein